MAKKRVHEVAKELNISSKELIDVLESYGVSMKSHMSTLDDHQVDWIKGKLAPEPEKPAAEEKKAKKPTEKQQETKVQPAGKEKTVRKSVSGPRVDSKTKRKEAAQSKRREPARQVAPASKEKPRKSIEIESRIRVGTLADKMGMKVPELIKRLMELGVMATVNQEIDFETAALVAEEFGFDAELVEAVEEVLPRFEDNPEDYSERPPVVTVMGHVDHGKTTLLDAIRNTKVTAQEAGGITQHIGAYQVRINGKDITFIDTPGHEAFTAMRARGAQATDIAVLVVAADDGVMPQTVEAINHARAAKIPVIVAINKIDKPNATPDMVRQQLSEHNLVPEEWGGKTVFVEISALKGQGINQLLEMILLVAEMEELGANPKRPAKGIVIESELDKGRGPVATVIVQNGTLKTGNSIAAGAAYGRVRSMTNDKGKRIREAGPSVPVQVQGFAEVPSAGERVYVVDDRSARWLSQKKKDEERERQLHQKVRASVDDFFKVLEEGEAKELNVVLKGDVHGSVEALKQSLERLNTDEVKVNVIHEGVGAINETDVMLAAASQAIIIGFNIRPDVNAKRAAEQEGVEVRLFRVIYEAIEDVTKVMSGMLDPEYREKVLGHAEVRATFKVPKVGMIAGCYISDGKFTNKMRTRVIRDGVVVHEGAVGSLRRFKDDVKEVEQGFECGIGVENFNDVKVGDVLEGFMMEEIERKL